jgi:hypothetical protein
MDQTISMCLLSRLVIEVLQAFDAVERARTSFSAEAESV